MQNLDLKPDEYREFDAKTYRWKAKPLRPFTPQPARPDGDPALDLPIFGRLATLAGLWAAGVIVCAHMVGGQNPWIIGPVALGPGLLMAVILIANDR